MYSNIFPIFLIWSAQAVFILRIVLGLVFVAHGWPKIKNLRETQTNFGAMGFKPGVLWGTVVAVLEFFGGIAIILGLFTQAIALFIAFEMLIAFLWKLKKGQGLVGGYELDLILLASALTLAALGGGAYALDLLI